MMDNKTTVRAESLRLHEDYKVSLEWIDSQKEVMLQHLISLASINSGTENIDGLAYMVEQLLELFSFPKSTCQVLPLPPINRLGDEGVRQPQQIGSVLRIKKATGAPRSVLLVGHMDTVFGREHPFQEVSGRHQGVLRGPGVADLKGGLVVMAYALQCFEKSPWSQRLDWEVLINADEEIGSPGSVGVLQDSAAMHDFGLVYEPSPADGSMVSSRKGTGTFTFLAKGRSAHAGRDFHAGRNAIHALSRTIVSLFALNGKREGVTINPGYIKGGGAANIVPDLAIVRVNIRTSKPEDERWVLQEIERIVAESNNTEGLSVTVEGRFSRPPKLLDGRHRSLQAAVDECFSMLGMPAKWNSSGGGCDGNNLSAAGLANIDTMGVVGSNIHTADEYMEVDSLMARAKLSALLLMRYACQDLKI